MSRIFRIAEMYHQQDSDATDDLTIAVAGATLAIPVTHAYVAKTTGGAEALTLADGKPGQILVINLTATGGAGTITPSTCTGFATIVLTAAGDFVTLLYVNDTVGWIILGMGGAANTPVVSV
jgi:hypothetical protein